MALDRYTPAQAFDRGSEPNFAGEACVEKQQAICMLEDAASLIADAELLVARTTGSLCGSLPADPTAGAIQQQPESVFDRIEEIARKLRWAANNISADMRRIQSRL